MAWAIWVVLGALFAGLGVGLGAFGAHALKNRLDPGALATFEIAVRYQMYHALALLFIGLAALRLDNLWIKIAGVLFTLGIICFSGSLYLMTICEQKQFALVTPVGGALFILGWLVVAFSFLVL